MFAKLLKHEWRSSRRTIGLLCGIILISGLLIGIMGFCAIQWELPFYSDHWAAEAAMSILMVVCIMAVMLSCAASVFYALWRFYRSRFTEEGYLTYTLPVGHHQLLLSGILISVWDIFLVMLAAVAAVAIALGMVSLTLPWDQLGTEEWDTFRYALNQVIHALAPHAGEILGALLMILVMCLSQLMLLMLCVTIGAMAAKKHPILMAIVTYYVVGFLRTVAFVGFLAKVGDISLFGAYARLDAASVVIAVVSYVIMYYLTSRKLNLT